MTIQVFHPLPFLYAFYEGRDGSRFSDQPNWVDDGALSLGIASYAIVDQDQALVYDTHVSPERGQFIRDYLAGLGVKTFTVVLSHWHLDHVAGTAAFADYPVLASAQTVAHLSQHREDIISGRLWGAPAISPLIMPGAITPDTSKLMIGRIAVELLSFEIHSDDATVVWLPDEQVLLAGDTLEDTLTYVDEPLRLDTHIQELDRLWQLAPQIIFPAHGDPEVIADGGYQRPLIRATQQYLRTLLRLVNEPELRDKPLAELIQGPLEMGWIYLFAPYEKIHARNLAEMLKAKAH